MTTDFSAIPIIDVSTLLEEHGNLDLYEVQQVDEVVKLLDQACKDAGFFYVKGHGVSDSLIKNARELTRRFFHLPLEEKVKIKLSRATGFRGYQKLAENITEGRPDNHEAIDYYREVTPGMYSDLGKVMEGTNPWPEQPKDFKEQMTEYSTKLKELSRKIMRGIAVALGGPDDAFEGDVAGNPFWVMRLIGYPGFSSKRDVMQEDGLGCGAHTDYGLLTLVNQDGDITALQVKNKSGEWIDVPPVEGTFVCNIGDMLKILSNGKYQPTIHRVLNSSPKYRTSVAFFYETNFDAPIEPMAFCKEKTGGMSQYGKVIYGEHLVSKVLNNFVV
ncbi:2-oxoglutarate (2OG) and Fe(II)-dependent oxygenase superfamily protein [Wolffia australiana]